MTVLQEDIIYVLWGVVLLAIILGCLALLLGPAVAALQRCQDGVIPSPRAAPAAGRGAGREAVCWFIIPA